MDKRCLLVALALIAGCSGSPAAPSSPKVTSITVTGSDLLLIGKSETFTATTDVPVAVRWGSYAPSVALVDATSGRVSAVGTGTASIYAEGNGVRGTKLIRTLPDFDGRWAVYYESNRCEANGEFWRDACAGGRPFYMDLTLIQNGESISGGVSVNPIYDREISYDFSPEELAGSVAANGTLSFAAVARQETFRLQMENVRFQVQGNRLIGTFEQVWSASGKSGSVRYFCILDSRVGGRTPR